MVKVRQKLLPDLRCIYRLSGLARDRRDVGADLCGVQHRQFAILSGQKPLERRLLGGSLASFNNLLKCATFCSQMNLFMSPARCASL
jgi:hypothetical protein